jgi:hypothetical protein
VDINIEPGLPPRNTEFHKRTVNAEPIPNRRSGYMLDLECGHEHVRSAWASTNTCGVGDCTETPTHFIIYRGRAGKRYPPTRLHPARAASG